MHRDDQIEVGPIRRRLLRLEPWLLGGIILFPWALAAVRWLLKSVP